MHATKPSTGLKAGLLAAGCASLLAAPLAAARAAETGVMPPLSVQTAHYFSTHPQARASFFAALAKRPAAAMKPTANRFASTAGGTWTAVAAAPSSGLCTPELMTDGTILFAVCNSKVWLKLTPDANGNYATGTWSAIASLPKIGGTQYAPQYHAAAVLPDTRLIVMGGEYNGSNSGVWTNLGAIYDPENDSWTPVTAPAGSSWSQIGDAQSTVLANGSFMLATCCADPAADAILNPKSLTWTATGAPAAGFGYQDEQGYELLPTDQVMTVDVWTNYPNYGATNAELYVPSTKSWAPGGNTTASLPDPCGYWEIGPAVTRANGTLVAFGGNTGCTTPADPVSIYNVLKKTWSAGPNVPQTCGSGTAGCTLADAPAALMPNGNILFAASSGFGTPPTHFFEFTSTNTIVQVADPLYNASSSGAYYYNFLVLPSGQIMMTDFSNTAEIYTPSGSAVASYAPVVTTMPTSLTPGSRYQFAGTQLNGLSQGAFYGDDAQMATNYPLVRITNVATGHVFYARSGYFSSMSVRPNAPSSAYFQVPTGIETGASTLEVVTNGIASTPIDVTIN